jgi:hypothetical protein
MVSPEELIFAQLFHQSTSLDPSHCRLLEHHPIAQKFILILSSHIRWEYNVKRILNKLGKTVWHGFIWLCSGPSKEFTWGQKWVLRFQNRRKISVQTGATVSDLDTLIRGADVVTRNIYCLVAVVTWLLRASWFILTSLNDETPL